MRKIAILSFTMLIFSSLSAATPEVDTTTIFWERGGIAGINLSQVSMSNWSGGGEPSVAYGLHFNYIADYKKKKTIFQNRAEMAFGQNYTQTNGTRKTDDKIYLSSMYGYKIANNLYLSGLFTFNTQFANGYNYGTTPKKLTSTFMAPGYFNLGVGVTWTPAPWLTIVASPATWRATAVQSDSLSSWGSFGVTPNERWLSEFGGNLRIEFKRQVMHNIHLYTRLDLFSNYFKNPQNIVVNWDTQLNMKINKWVSASLNLNLIYDDKIHFLKKNGSNGPRLQLKEVLGVGLATTF